MADLPETRYAVTRDGAHIAYRIMGTGPPELVFIPPWTSSVELDVDDPYVGPTVRRLASIGRFVSYDKRGTGMSDPVEPGACPTLEERADELMAVLDASGCDRPTVFTGADGAAVAMMFAATYPEKLNALCLYAPFARVIEAPDYPIGYSREVVDFMVETAGRAWGRGEIAPTAPSLEGDERFLEWFGRYQRRSGSPSAGKRFLRMAIETDVRDVLPLIRVPTVVLHRSGDQLIPIAAGRYVADHIPGARFIELEGIDHFWAVGDLDSVLDEVEEVATGVRPITDANRVLATVMFTDIVRSTERATELGDRRWRELLDAHDAAVRIQLQRFGGREINTTGDGFFATFDGPGRAIRCACAVRDTVRPLAIEVRAGLHIGEIELRGDDVTGMAVHIGARVSALAAPGEVLVSSAIPPLVFGSGIDFDERGEHRLKGVPGSWTLFAVDG
ncbi:MAG: serine aminopeptidase domain-containing protein [Acidimicrobiia bacterium]